MFPSPLSISSHKCRHQEGKFLALRDKVVKLKVWLGRLPFGSAMGDSAQTISNKQVKTGRGYRRVGIGLNYSVPQSFLSANCIR
jgi:hypothetical protein